MRLIGLVTAVLSLLVFSPFDALANNTAWVRYEPQGCGCRILMPAQPSITIKNLDTAAGNIELTQAQFGQASTAYTVDSSFYPAVVIDRNTADAVLEMAQGGMLRSAEATAFRAVSDLSKVDRPERTFTFDSKGFHYRVRLVLVGNMLLQLIYNSTGEIPSTDSEKFLNSLIFESRNSQLQRGGPNVVPMQLDGGTYTVPVRINGAITLQFVLDSGATDVSIPADVVSTLIRTGTLGPGDFIGSQTYVLADGSKVPSVRFRIRQLQVGNSTVRNVVGSVASAKGSLLLGQSFLTRFKTWSIDNSTHNLVLQQ